MVQVNPEPTHSLSAGVLLAIQEPKKILGLGAGKERAVEKFGHPIHLAVIGDVKRDLQVLVRVLNNDDAIVIDLWTSPLPFIENDAALASSVGRMCNVSEKKARTLGKVRGRGPGSAANTLEVTPIPTKPARNRRLIG